MGGADSFLGRTGKKMLLTEGKDRLTKLEARVDALGRYL